MHEPDPETLARSRRVHALCQELAQLFIVSLEQRRVMDRLLKELEQVTQRARARLGQLPRARGVATGTRLDCTPE